MKKLLLLLLIYNFGFGQVQTFQIKLVNPNVGLVNYSSVFSSSGYTSNDAGLNQIFLNHNIISYYDGMGRPNGDNYSYKLMDCSNCNANQLIADLTAYSSVVQKANISAQVHTFSDIVSFSLANINIGTPTGVGANNIITTNSSLVSQIFQTHNVYFYDYFYPFGFYNQLMCDCNVGNLVNDLLSNNVINPNVIDTVNPNNNVINYYYSSVGGLLINAGYEKSKPLISPNPFTTHFDIETDEVISNYSLFDISGKELINTNSKTALDNLSSQLNIGVYFLNLQLDNGQKSNYKIVKK